MEPTEQPFFDDAYLRRLYGGQRREFSLLAALGRRFSQQWAAPRADLYWVEKEVLPWLPASFERVTGMLRTPMVVDLDDAIFHAYDLHPSAVVRRVLGQKIDRIMASSAMVTAGNHYLADRAMEAGACGVELVPTVVDLDRYPAPVPSTTRQPTLGWIGTPSTCREYVVPILPLLTDVASSEGVRIVLVGAGTAAPAHLMLDNLPWSEETEVARIREMDIGIMPLRDTPWARGKCGYKLIQYMACGVPVVASPVGVNAEIVEHGVNGFLASTDAEWREALETLLHDAKLRERMGAAGRRKVERQYSLQVWGPRVAAMLRDVAERGPTRSRRLVR